MSAAIVAARECANTILWHSLRVDAFQGAIPHVLFVVDRVPCTLQKVLLEGYIREMNGFNGADVGVVNDASPLRIGLDLCAETPCYSKGLESNWKFTYTVLPFKADSFLNDVKTLQAFLRECGGSLQQTEVENGKVTTARPPWSRERMKREFDSLASLLAPEDNVKEGWSEALFEALCSGPYRELLGCILIQRNAFQNELEKYRLRLDLFNMGLRVAEHNHLEIMSASADALVAKCECSDAGASEHGALENKEIIHYMRSCSFKPDVAESIGRAIADSIDAWSWTRRLVTTEEGDASGNSEPISVVPPPSFLAALANDNLWSLYGTGVLSWKGDTQASDVSADDQYTAASVNPSATTVITGPGAPLRIVSHTGGVLTYDGGLEDCLLNTGYYTAAHTVERNSVRHHRERFPTCDSGCEENRGDTLVKEEGSGGAPPGSSMAAPSDGEHQGRLKKKEYLALQKLKLMKDTTKRGSYPSGEEDVGRGCGFNAASGVGACVGCSIGGTFPVGEVISESFDLSKLSGTCDIFAYPSLSKAVTMSQPKPATLTIKNGIVTDISADAPKELMELIELVRQAEGDCCVRELGIGLSPYLGRDRAVSDVTAFERQFGVHLSLGQRHPLFVKQTAKRNADGKVAVVVEGPVLKRRAGKYHIDVFVDAARLEMGNFVVDFTKGLVDSTSLPVCSAYR